MSMAPSSRRARRSPSRALVRLFVASCAIALASSIAAIAGEPIQHARFTEENLPEQDMPTVVATPQAGASADWIAVPASAATKSAPPAPGAASPSTATPGINTPLPAEATPEPTPIPTPTDIPPLEVGSVAPQIQISDASLDPLIQSVRTSQPALAASLRVTDQAREELLAHREADAIQTLGRAISIDGSNPYAYFYLGRAYLAKKNYTQAITFLTRAESRLGANSAWLGETFAFEGLANERAGQNEAAIAAYQKALVAVPGNLMARVGLTRLGSDMAGPTAEPASTASPSDETNDDSASDENDDAAPTPESSPAPPAKPED